MVFGRSSDAEFIRLVAHFERAVALGKSFGDPKRQSTDVLAEKEVDVLMEHNIGRTDHRSHSDVIDIFTGLEECEHVGRLPLIERLVWFQGLVILKD